MPCDIVQNNFHETLRLENSFASHGASKPVSTNNKGSKSNTFVTYIINHTSRGILSVETSRTFVRTWLHEKKKEHREPVCAAEITVVAQREKKRKKREHRERASLSREI